MMDDGRTKEEATMGLLSPALAAPLSPEEQMKEKYGTGGTLLRMLGVGLSGGLLGNALLPEMGRGARTKYASELEAYDRAAKRQEQADFMNGLDMDNLTLAQIGQLADFDAGLGKVALDNYTFNQQVSDLGRAQGFASDGIDDENDLWASETFRRYGRATDGTQTTLDKTLQNAGYTESEFSELSTETQEAILYQFGTDEYRAASDRVAGRKTLDQIEAEGAAGRIGTASGDLTAEAIGFLPNAPKIAQDQDFAMQGVDDLITMFQNGEIDTGKWTQMMKDTFGYQTAADGKLGLESTKNLISQINAATFGALSEREIETLEKTFANGGFTEEANLEILNDVKKKLQLGKDQHGRKTDESLRRIKEYAPEEYEFFMADDKNWIQYGDPAKLPTSESGVSFAEAWPMMQQDGLSREEAIVRWRDDLKAEREAKAEAEKKAEQARKDAEMAMGEMSEWTESWAGNR